MNERFSEPNLMRSHMSKSSHTQLTDVAVTVQHTAMRNETKVCCIAIGTCSHDYTLVLPVSGTFIYE